MSEHPIHPSDLTVACYVRAPLLLDPVDSKIETLRRCEAAGDIGALVLRSWSDEVSLAADSPGQEVVDHFERFEGWADAHGVSVRPPFRIRTSTSLAADEPKPVLVTPLLCLALYDEDRLVGVYPHTEGDTTRTVSEAIAAFTTGELPAGLAIPDVERSSADASAEMADGNQLGTGHQRGPTATVCPACEGPLANVQGILACAACRWTDAALDELETPRAKLVYLSLLDGPVSVETLQAALDLNKLSLLGILRTLDERGLVEEVESGTYLAKRGEVWEGERLVEVVGSD